MIVVDTSAIFAIVLEEPEERLFRETILAVGRAVIGAPTLFECRLVAQGRSGLTMLRELDIVLEALGLEVLPFEAEHVLLATEAFRRFGKGRDRAGLNFGDCMSYAIAKQRREPLLFKGDDFRRTDIEAAA